MNLEYRWFYGLSIEDRIPDRSAFSRMRNERFRDSNRFEAAGLVQSRLVGFQSGRQADLMQRPKRRHVDGIPSRGIPSAEVDEYLELN